MGAAVDRRADMRADGRPASAARSAERAPTGTRTREGVRAGIALLLLFVLIYLLPLGVRPLASPDEVRYGAVSHEMIASGDWVAPHFNGVRYFEKPVLGLWLNSVSMKLLGETPFALRLPVALATGLTTLIVFALARRYTTPFAARLAAGIYLTTFLVAGLGTFAVLDAFLALFLTAALAAFYRALAAGEPRSRRLYLGLCGTACGGAFLVKGFLALAIPVVVAAPYLAARRRWRMLLVSPWIPIAVAGIVVLPWAVAIALREPDFWHYFFWVEHIQRFTASDAQHAQPLWYYFAWLPLAGWPWVLLLPAALLGLLRGSGGETSAARGAPTGLTSARPGDAHGPASDSDDRAAASSSDGRTAVSSGDTGAPAGSSGFLGYLAAWAAFPLLFLSLSKGKLPTYLLPCFAPLAILLAAGLERYLAACGRSALRAAALVVAAVFAVLLAAIVAGQAGAFGPRPFAPDEIAKLAGLAACLAAGCGLAIYAASSAAGIARLAALAGTTAMLILPLEVMLPESVLQRVSPATVVARYASTTPDTILVSDAPLFGTVAWVLKRNDIYVLSPGEIEYGLSYPEARHRSIDAAGLERLIEANRGRHDLLLVCGSSTDKDIERVLPATALRSEHGDVILWQIPAA